MKMPLEIFAIFTDLVLLTSLANDIKLNRRIKYILFIGLISLTCNVLFIIFPYELVKLCCGTMTAIFICMYAHNYKELAYKDGLTGLHNRNYLVRLKVPKSGTIVVIDVDKFKHINDKYGHKIGDQVLIELSQILRKSVRTTDHVIRYGGDEFLIIIPNPCKRDLIQTRINDRIVEHNKVSNIMLSISIGSYEFERESNTEMSTLIDIADQLMFAIKKEKKDD